MTDVLGLVSEALRIGEGDDVRAAVEKAHAAGIPAGEILRRGLVEAMAVVGEEFGRREIFLPDVLLAARAMQAGLDVLRPHLSPAESRSEGCVVLGTVRGDLHDIGKNLVGILLQGAGFEVVDLGTDVPAELFVSAALEREARVVGLSALLTTTMPRMREVVDLVRERGLAGRLRVLVGGAPVTAAFARQIGADAYAFDASSAVEKVRELLASS